MDFPCDNFDDFLNSLETFDMIEIPINNKEEMSDTLKMISVQDIPPYNAVNVSTMDPHKVLTADEADKMELVEGNSIIQKRNGDYVIVNHETGIVSVKEFRETLHGRITVVRPEVPKVNLGFLHHLAEFEDIVYDGEKIQCNKNAMFTFSGIDVLMDEKCQFTRNANDVVMIGHADLGVLDESNVEHAIVDGFYYGDETVVGIKVGTNFYVAYNNGKGNVVTRSNTFLARGGLKQGSNIYLLSDYLHEVLIEGDVSVHRAVLYSLKKLDNEREDVWLSIGMVIVKASHQFKQSLVKGKRKYLNVPKEYANCSISVYDNDDSMKVLKYMNVEQITCDFSYMEPLISHACDLPPWTDRDIQVRGKVFAETTPSARSDGILYYNKSKILCYPVEYCFPWYWTSEDVKVYRLVKLDVEKRNKYVQDYFQVWEKTVGKVIHPAMGKLRKSILIYVAEKCGDVGCRVQDLRVLPIIPPVLLGCIHYGIKRGYFSYDAGILKNRFVAHAKIEEVTKSLFCKYSPYCVVIGGIFKTAPLTIRFSPNTKKKRRTMFDKMKYGFEMSDYNIQKGTLIMKSLCTDFGYYDFRPLFLYDYLCHPIKQRVLGTVCEDKK